MFSLFSGENRAFLGMFPRATDSFMVGRLNLVVSPAGLVNRARFEELRDVSGLVMSARLADFGVFFLPEVFFLAEERFAGDFVFDALE